MERLDRKTKARQLESVGRILLTIGVIIATIGTAWIIHDGISLLQGDTRGELLGACILESVGDIITGAILGAIGGRLKAHARKPERKPEPVYYTRRHLNR